MEPVLLRCQWLFHYVMLHEYVCAACVRVIVRARVAFYTFVDVLINTLPLCRAAGQVQSVSLF